jgi:hypothetical protein
MKILLFSIFIILFSCAQNNVSTIKKDTLLIAYQKFSSFGNKERYFKIYSDSTFIFKEIIKDELHTKNELWKGKVLINKDTIRFYPHRLDFNKTTKAVLKNGFVEFIDGEIPERFIISSSSLFQNKFLELDKYVDYSIFTFYNKTFDYFSIHNQFTNYDLNSKELEKTDFFISNLIKNDKKFKQKSEYVKQVFAIKDAKNDVFVHIYLYCKDEYILNSFKYYWIEMDDGGDCNMFISYNLTHDKLDNLIYGGY